MTISAEIKIEQMQRLQAKILGLVGPKQEALLLRANNKNADEFMAGIQAIIPRGDPKDGNLVDTLKKGTYGGVSAWVSIGGPGAFHYPMHLEAGHRNKDGSHTPGKPFWNPTKRVTSKRAHARIVRAERVAMKSLTAKPG